MSRRRRSSRSGSVGSNSNMQDTKLEMDARDEASMHSSSEASVPPPSSTRSLGEAYESTLFASPQVVELTEAESKEKSAYLQDHKRQNESQSGGQSGPNSLEPEPEPWSHRHPFVSRDPPKALDKDAWELIRQAMKKYDKEMCKAWNGELDTILVFAGLFSAAVTAFCVESFQTLSPNPVDMSNTLLLSISLQLANSSSPVASASLVHVFSPAKHDVYTNVLYFLSLVLALSMSSVCILAKQWIREYEKDIPGTPSDAVRVRQMRYDSIQAWKVPQIIAALPVLVIITLLLFFAGLLIQLWHASEHTTAICVTIVVALTGLFVIVTTVSPTSYASLHSRASFVPFRSPQAWLFFSIYQKSFSRPHIFWAFVRVWYTKLLQRYIGRHFPGINHWGRSRALSLQAAAMRARSFTSWTESDLHALESEAHDWFDHEISSVHRALRWVGQTLLTSETMQSCILWCLQSPESLPRNLIQDTSQLARYVTSKNVTDSGVWGGCIWFDMNVRRYGSARIGAPMGRQQTELLLRTLNDAIDVWPGAWKSSTGHIVSCLVQLVYIWPHQPADDGLVEYQIQIALMLRRLFDKLPHVPPSLSLPPLFWYPCLAFLHAHIHPSGSIIKELDDSVMRDLFAFIRSRHSISQALDVVQQPLGQYGLRGFKACEHPLAQFDRVLLDLWDTTSLVKEKTRENLERWRIFRLRCARIVSGGPTKQSLEDYFTSLNGALPAPETCTVPVSKYETSWSRFFGTL